MILSFDSIELLNFKSFQGSHRFTFPKKPGLYFVTGDNKAEKDLTSNGAGKSTIFTDSIYWCLTGKTIRDNRPGDAVENWTVSGMTSVVLTIEIDGQLHTVRRTRRPNSFTIDGEMQHQSNVFKLLQLSEESLRHTILIGQFGELFLDLKPEQQASMFTELLNLNVWLDASNKASAVSRQSSQQLDKLEREKAALVGRIQELDGQIESTKVALDSFEGQKQSRIRGISDAYDKATLELKKFDKETYSKDTKVINIELPIKELQVLEVDLNEFTIKENALERNLVKLRFSWQQDNSTLSKYKDAEVCPECGQVVDKAHIESRIIELNDNLTEFQHFIAEGEGMLKEVEGEISKRRKVIGVKRDELEITRREQLEASRRQNEILKARSVLRVEVDVQERLLKEEQARPNLFIDRLKDLETRCNNAKTQLSNLFIDCSNLEKKIGYHDYWMDAFKEIRLNLIDSVLQELEVSINNHAQAHGLNGWSIKFQTERVTQSGNVSHKFNVLLYPPDQNEAIPWESYSGGEVQRWQLSATEGLAEVLLGRSGINPDIEILDEPTAHLSEQGIEDLLIHLKERAVNLGRRIVFIDHKSLDYGEFDGIIRIVKDGNGSRIDA